jgi:XTP/dITP diphosphohydrolase
VFGDAEAATAGEVVDLWELRKAVEKPHRTSVLDGIPQGMPSLALAAKVLGRAHKVGVHPTASTAATTPSNMAPSNEDELGAMLLSIVAEAQANGLDAERALRTTLRGLQDRVRAAEG